MQTHPVEAVKSPAWHRAARRGIALATGGYTAVLVFATHYPKPESLLGRALPSDKLMHFWAYAVLGGLVAATLIAYGWRDAGTLVRMVVVLAVAAILDELTQPYFGRAAEPLDWVCDCVGLVAGGATVFVSSWAWERGMRRS